MAGTLVIDTLKSSTANPPAFQNTSGTEVGQLCRAWVNFDGTTGTKRASFNVSSVARNSTGDYTVNFTSALTDANYAVTTCVEKAAGGYIPSASINASFAPAAGSVRILTGSENLTNDRSYIHVAFFR